MRIPGTAVHVYSPFDRRNRADRRNREAANNAAANPPALPPRNEIPQPAPVRRVLGVAIGGRLAQLPAPDGGGAPAAPPTAQIATQTDLQPFTPPTMTSTGVQAGPSTSSVGLPHRPQQVNASVQNVPRMRSIGIQHDGSQLRPALSPPPNMPVEVIQRIVTMLGDNLLDAPRHDPDLASFMNLSRLSRRVVLHPIVQNTLLSRRTRVPGDRGTAALLQTIGTPGQRPSIRSLPPTLQERPLANLVRLMASHNFPFVHPGTRQAVLPVVMQAIGALPVANVARVLTEAFSRGQNEGLYEQGRTVFSNLLGNPDAPRAGTIAGLPGHLRERPLRQAVEQLYPSLPPRGTDRRTIAALVNNLPAGVGEDLKEQVRTP